MTVTATPQPRISEAGKQKLDELLDAKVAEGKIPAIFFGATNSEGEIYFNAKGDKVLGHPEKGQINENTTLQLFSQTKFITSLACLQLWEKGLLDFDDEEILKKHCPELMEQKVLQGFDDNGQPNLVERTHPLTVRRLLTHTSGLTYNFLTPHLIGRWQVMHKKGGFLDKNAGVESLTEPLIFQPGTKYAYSIGIDWAGVLVSRISGQTLGEYFDEHIFKPCGVTKLTFFPTDEIKANLMQLCGRDETPERNLIHATGFRSVPDLTPEDIGLHAGGAGLLGTLKDYLTLLRHVLQCKDRDGVIKKSTFPLLFQSAFPPREENGKTHTCYTDLGQILGFLGVDEDQYTSGEHASHSLALCVLEADSKYGRKAGSANWGGIAKTQFWIDPTTGIAAVCGTQLMDPLDQTATVRVWKAYERQLYDVLE